MTNKLKFIRKPCPGGLNGGQVGEIGREGTRQRRQAVNKRLEEALQAQVRTEPQEQVEQQRRQDDRDVVGYRIKSRQQRGEQSRRRGEFT